MDKDLVPIEKKDGVTLFGRLLPGRRLGKFEVHSAHQKYDGLVHNTYTEAATRKAALIGAYHDKEREKNERQSEQNNLGRKGVRTNPNNR